MKKLFQLAIFAGALFADIGEQAYELQFQTRRFHGLKHAANSLGYGLVPKTQEMAATG